MCGWLNYKNMKLSTSKYLLAGILSCALIPTCSVLSAAEPAKTDALFADPIVAKGKGFEIKQSRVTEAFILYKSNVAAQGGDVPDEQRPKIQADLLERLIVTEMLMHRATDADKAKGKEASEKYIADMKQQLGTEESFNTQIKATGMNLDQFRARLLEQEICETVLDREVKSQYKVSDDSARKFYEENPTQFEKKEQVRASHILISTIDPKTKTPYPPEVKKEKEKLARDIKAQIEKGEDFGKLVKQYSDDPGSKDTGGEYTFPKGQMVPEFEAAAFSMKTNQVSDLVETRFGYHIIKTLEKIPAGKMEYAKVSKQIQSYLENQQLQRVLPPYFEKLKKENEVEIVGQKEKAKS